MGHSKRWERAEEEGWGERARKEEERAELEEVKGLAVERVDWAVALEAGVESLHSERHNRRHRGQWRTRWRPSLHGHHSQLQFQSLHTYRCG
jgi:hypothetical protein